LAGWNPEVMHYHVQEGLEVLLRPPPIDALLFEVLEGYLVSLELPKTFLGLKL
jgi:hypothetical protein